MAVLADRLRDEHCRLDELRVGDLEVRASLELSCRGLDTADRRAFGLLGMLGLPDFAPWLLQPLLDLPAAEAERSAERLADAQLLDLTFVDSRVRYRFHDLVRLYASDRCDAEIARTEQVAAMHRVLRWWLAVVDAAARQPSGVLGLRGVGPPPPVPALPIEPAVALDTERAGLVRLVERASELGLDEACCDLAAALVSSSFRVNNRFEEWRRTHDAALAAARRAGNLRGQAVLSAGLGQLRHEEDRFRDADEYFLRALGLFREVGDAAGEATALAGLGAVRKDQGHYAEALQFLEQAHSAFRAVGDPAGVAAVGYDIGAVKRRRPPGYLPSTMPERASSKSRNPVTAWLLQRRKHERAARPPAGSRAATRTMPRPCPTPSGHSDAAGGDHTMRETA